VKHNQLRVLKVSSNVFTEPLSLIRVFRNTHSPLQELHLSDIGEQYNFKMPVQYQYHYARYQSGPSHIQNTLAAKVEKWLKPEQIPWDKLALAVQPELTTLVLKRITWLEHHHLLALFNCLPNLKNLTLYSMPGVTNRLFRKLRVLLFCMQLYSD